MTSPTRSMHASRTQRVRIALCLWLLAFTFHASAKLIIGGSYENTLTAMVLERSGDVRVYDENRLRLDFDAKIGETVSFDGDLIFRKYVGATNHALTDFLPDTIGQALEAAAAIAGTQVPVYAFSDTFYVDNAAVFLQKNRTIFAVGIQQLPWGSGYAFNPTDLWNTKDILDPTYEKPGKPAIKFEQGLGALSVAAALGFDDNLRHAPWTVSLGTHVQAFDITLIGGSKVREFSDELLGGETFNFRRYLTGLSLSGQVADIGVWAEAAANREETDNAFVSAYKDSLARYLPLLPFLGIPSALLSTDHLDDRTYVQALVGADYTFAVGNGLHLMAEYLYNGDGKSDEDDYTLEDWTDYFMGENLTLGSHTLFGGLSFSPTGLSALSLYAIGNASDHSLILNPWFTYNITNDCGLDISAALPFGRDNTEYGLGTYLCMVRLKVFW